MTRYEWLKKRHTVTSSASRFSRYAKAPGNFSILSVALKENQVSIPYCVQIGRPDRSSANERSTIYYGSFTPYPRSGSKRD